MKHLRINIDLYETNKKEILKNIPHFIRIGKSMIYPVLDKIKQLQLLEELVPATKLADLSSGTMVGVSIPAGNYYVFTHKGGIDTLPLTYSSIMEEIKSSGMTQDYYWIEAYDERYQSNSSESEFDILVPVLSIEK